MVWTSKKCLEQSVPFANGGKDVKGNTQKKMDGLFRAGYEGKNTVPGRCAGQDRVEEDRVTAIPYPKTQAEEEKEDQYLVSNNLLLRNVM